MNENKINSHIVGMGYYAPENIIDNEYFTQFMDTSDEWITERTGIKQRRFANTGQGPADISIPAVKMALKNAQLTVNDIDGTSRTVVAPDGFSYLTSTNPRADFEAITVADYTFIVNTATTVAKSSTVDATRPYEALYSVKQGITATEYNIVIDGTTYSYTTTGTASTYQAENIVDELRPICSKVN